MAAITGEKKPEDEKAEEKVADVRGARMAKFEKPAAEGSAGKAEKKPDLNTVHPLVMEAIAGQKRLREKYKETQKILREMEEKTRKEEEDSLSLAHRFQEEEDKAAESRRQELEAKQETTCGICLFPIASTDLLPLDRCGHLFHPQCMREYLKTQVIVHSQSTDRRQTLPFNMSIGELQIGVINAGSKGLFGYKDEREVGGVYLH